MKCPKCGEDLKASFSNPKDKDANYVEVELVCINNHLYFTRIREPDLIEL